MPPPALIDHGIPVTSSRQWATGWSPNPTNDGWNYIVQSWIDTPNPTEWVVLGDLTGSTPIQTITNGTTHYYANTRWQYAIGQGQLRAGNGRIFFPCFGNNIVYYEPTNATIHFLPTVVETPPVNPNASTIPYSAVFDTAGILYFGTQESAHRQGCVFAFDPVTLALLFTWYVGDNALAYTTYVYYLAADTITATKTLYEVYGENPWQLWATDIPTGIGTKLKEVPASGHMAFSDIVGQGWIVTIDTDLGQPDNVRTQWWCLDGNVYPYTFHVAPPVTARNVTPASNPLVNPPGLDASGGIGVVGWRPPGSSGAYHYVNYSVVYRDPISIESLVTTPTGVFGNAVQYQGFFNVDDASGDIVWYGVEGTGMGISEGPRITVQSTEIYIAGYPDGVLYGYDPLAPWQASAPPSKNPKLLGNYGPSGIQLAGIKYATTLAWSQAAGASGRLYCAGTRDRNGTGAGIGYYDLTTKMFAGTFASPLDTVQPGGLLPPTATMALVALDVLACVVLSTRTISGAGTAPLYIFDHDLNLIDTQMPIASANIGQIFPAHTDPAVICGVMQSGTHLAVYRHDVQTNTLLALVVTSFVGTIGPAIQNVSDGAVYVAVGNALVRVDSDTLAVTNALDITTIAPAACLAFYGSNLYLSSGAELWSAQLAQAAYTMDAATGMFEVNISPATFTLGSHGVLVAETGQFEISVSPAIFSVSFNMQANTGTFFARGGDARFVTHGPELIFESPSTITPGKQGTSTIYVDSPVPMQRRIAPIGYRAVVIKPPPDEE